MKRRILAALLAASLGFGCSFVDELDKSSAEMDKYSPSARAAAEAKKKADAEKQAAAATKTGKGLTAEAREAASKWWGKAHTLAPDEADQDIVRCILAGKREEYMRSHDCAMRGGATAKGKL
jgi:hypothetical protein